MMHLFQAFKHYFAMGGFAEYVWPAFGIVAVVLIGNLVQAMRQHRKLMRTHAPKT